MTIQDFAYISTILDTTGISASSNIEALIPLTSIDAIQIAHVSDGEFEIDNSEAFASLMDCLVDNELVEDAETDMSWVFEGCQDCNLRASELLKMLVYYCRDAHSHFALDGTLMAERRFNVRRYGSVRMGSLGNTGVLPVSGLIPQSILRKGVLSVNNRSAAANSTNSYTGNLGWLNVKNDGGFDVTITYEDGTQQVFYNVFADTEIFYNYDRHVDHGVIVAIWGDWDVDVRRSITIDSSGDVWCTLEVVRHARPPYSPDWPGAQVENRFTQTVKIGATSKTQLVPSRIASVSFGTMDCTLCYKWQHGLFQSDLTTSMDFGSVQSDVSVSGAFYPYLIGEVGASSPTVTISVPNPDPDLPDDSITISCLKNNWDTQNTALQLAPSDVTVTGVLNGGLTPESYRWIIDPITSTPGDHPCYNYVPTRSTGQAGYTVPQDVFFNHVAGTNTPSISRNAPTSRQVFSDYVYVDFNRVEMMNQIINDIDRVSPVEALSQASASALSRFFDGLTPLYDPYVDMLNDNTAMIIVEYELGLIADMLSNGTNILNDIYGVDFFDNFDAVADTSYQLPETDYIEVSEGEWQRLDHLVSDWCTYDNGYLHVLEDHRVNIDHFSIDGVCLSDAAYHHDMEFLRKVLRARIDVQTQTLLYATINGVLSSTDWLGDAARWLREVVEDVRHTVQTTLSALVDIPAFTVSDRDSLLAGAACMEIPATRVAEIIDTVSAAGAASANQALSIISALGVADSAAQISDATSKSIVDSIISRIPALEDYKSHATAGKPRSTSVPYGETFFTRQAAAIFSSVAANDGVESDVVDMGIGLSALYPALIIGNCTVSGVLPAKLQHAIVLPLTSSYVVITSGYTDYNYDVAWYAMTQGGTDQEIVNDVECSLRELKTFVDTIGAGLGPQGHDITLSYDDPSEATYVGDTSVVHLMSVLMGAITGAAYGYLVGTIKTNDESVTHGGAGAKAGAILGGIIALCGEIDQYDVTKANISYNLLHLDNLGITVTDGTEQYSGQVLGNTIAEMVMGALNHGAFYPYGNDSQIGTDFWSMMAPGRAFFRYLKTGSSQDVSPFIVSAFGLLSVWSARTCIKAYTKVTRNPGFIPLVTGSLLGNSLSKGVGVTYKAVASEYSNDYVTQRQLMDTFSAYGEAEGVYTDSEGTVTLRDILVLDADIRDKLALLNETVSQPNTAYLTY